MSVVVSDIYNGVIDALFCKLFHTIRHYQLALYIQSMYFPYD